jgi:hypothetical protein
MGSHIHRCLVGLDVRGVARILATDSSLIAFDATEIDSDCEQIGILDAKDIGAGLWLWVGTVTASPWGPDGEYEPQYDGSVRYIGDMAEAMALFSMSPPEPIYPDEDRESPGV